MRPARSDRRLAAARRAHHRHQPAGPQPLDQLADHRLPAEEVGAVLRLEGEQAAVRALGRGKWGSDAGRLDRAHPLGFAESAQAMRAEIDQFAALGEMRGDQLGRNRREEDLPAVGLVAQLGREVYRRPEVVGAAAFGLAGVNAEANRDRQILGPRLGRQRARGSDRGGERVRRRVEHRDG